MRERERERERRDRRERERERESVCERETGLLTQSSWPRPNLKLTLRYLRPFTRNEIRTTTITLLKLFQIKREAFKIDIIADFLDCLLPMNNFSDIGKKR